MTTKNLQFQVSDDTKKLLNVGPKNIEALMTLHNVNYAIVEDMVASIRDWYQKQPHLPQGKLEIEQIIGHLFLGRFSVERVKATIDSYFSAKHRIPDYLTSRDPLQEPLSEYIKYGYWVIMPRLSKEGYRTTIFRMNSNEERSLIEIMKVASMVSDIRIRNDCSIGDRWILDLENVSLSLVMQMTPDVMSKIMFYLMRCFTARLISVHVVSVPSFAAKFVYYYKKMFKLKIAQRIHIANIDDLTETFSKEDLPHEYGGTGGTCKEISDEWCKTMQSDKWRKFFIEHDNILTDESKRLVPTRDNDFFGLNGSFRKLNLD